MENDLVRYSRAGDTFHYRWAARRCLRMIDPKSPIKSIVIEGSKERGLAGEYVIDVAEYSILAGSDNEVVTYFQLKHSTKRLDQPFNLSDLKDTIKGFAARFKEYYSPGKERASGSAKFAVITNRPISGSLKKGILAASEGEIPTKRFYDTLKAYTGLKDKKLQEFCQSLELIDGEGDYDVQRHELHAEILKFVAGSIESAQIDSIVALVQDQALPGAKREIVREDILKRLGVRSERDLFPAPVEFEPVDHLVKRAQHDELFSEILKATAPVIIHASGGVGKSIVARQLADTLSRESLGVIYDCFGSGKYRNPSEPRHRHEDALVEVANEIASDGLCELLIPQTNDKDDALLRAFLSRIQVAAEGLRRINKNAVLVILVDAADNAEMAAREFSGSCFASNLLRVQVPDGCRIVELCRTERINLLSPPSSVRQVELQPFNEAETLAYFREYYPDVTDLESLEFHRLTSGNPRVQANALSVGKRTIAEILASLGPSGTTVDDQISAQLDSAVERVKEVLPSNFQKHIEAICLGLANLPPFIPIRVLAAAADVDIDTVKSFVADLGKPLWFSDNSVQFRDEPTETWFRQNYAASSQQIESYIARLQPFASEFSYVAEVLPSLLLQAGRYDQLISLALSDDYLPTDSPIDMRHIRMYRLQFAFKAALKKKQYVDAAKLAFRAGEEAAGDTRQLKLLKENVDLITPLQSEQRVQELAFRRMLRGEWDGSENVYSAALLSSVEDFKGEARAYLRAANNWLRLYFDERKKNPDDLHYDRLKDEDIVEMTFTRFHFDGAEGAVDFILSWIPPEVVFRVARLFVRRLVDAGNFPAINRMAEHGYRDLYLMVAIADELLAVGQFPPADAMSESLNLFTHRRTRIPKPDYEYENSLSLAIISFAEACAALELSNQKTLRVLRHYVPQRASYSVGSDHRNSERIMFLRATALQAVISGNLDIDLETLLPQRLLDERDDYDKSQEIKSFKEVVGGLLPWYIIRSGLLIRDYENFGIAMEQASQAAQKALTQRYRRFDSVPFETAQVRFEILTLNPLLTIAEVKDYGKYFDNEDCKFRLNDRLNAVRVAYRLDHLKGLREKFEQYCFEAVMAASDEESETRADWYIDLARAVLPAKQADAAAYFDYAIDAVSKFGDEVVERWEALASIANRSAEIKQASPEIVYRFMRCAELVGDSVAREKHFRRNNAVEICAKMNPNSAFAALSRWRDRDVGWFDRQLPALAYEAVASKAVSPAAGWALSAFSWEYRMQEFVDLCIKSEEDATRRQYILDTAVQDLRLNDAPGKVWGELDKLAKNYSLENTEINRMLSFYAAQPEESRESASNQYSVKDYKEDTKQADWNKMLESLNLLTNMGLVRALDRFEASPVPRYPEVFWDEVYKRIPEKDASSFLQVVIQVENIDSYGVRLAFSRMPRNWLQLASVKRIWQDLILSVIRRFAIEFTSPYTFDYFIESIPVDGLSLASMQLAIMEGLSDSSRLVGASTFFGFADIVASFISPQEALDLLSYALSRFELHINEDYADGLWDDWLNPPEDTSKAFTGFIWAALGSPCAETRWEAAHSVRRLAEVGCSQEIDNLIEWMKEDHVGAFGSNKLPFYNLHARQYLLIALARIAIDNPGILQRHHKVFQYHALEGEPHIIIQKFAAETAIAIEKSFPGTYDSDTTTLLQKVGVSQLPVLEIKRHREKVDSPWHASGKIDLKLRLHFAFDFDRYWFDPLGNVFGITGKQVEDLAREIVFKRWHIKPEDEFIRDPRSKMWSSGRHERKTWHDHGSYPRVDDYSFYVSYHAMLAVASKLLQAMPVVHEDDWYDDEWAGWLSRHTLTRSDGRWLSDRRDPAPLERRAWIRDKKTEDWRKTIHSEDFLDGLLMKRDDETWLNVRGGWTDTDTEHIESYYITSALVSPEGAQSLLYALSACANPHDFKLPCYDEEDMEHDEQPFELKGWIWRDSPHTRLDEFDPEAAKIEYPPYRVGDSFIDQLKLTADLEQREWFLADTDQVVMRNEIWSMAPGEEREEREEPYRHGNRMSASLDFLKEICNTFDCEIIFEVEIERRLKRNYYSRRNDDGYQPPFSKIYVFTADGKLRDTGTRFQLR